MSEIRTYCSVTLDTILKGNEELTIEENERIFLSVHHYIEKSKRFDRDD